MTETPRFIQDRRKSRANGLYRESHAPPSMRFHNCEPCSKEAGEETVREFQLSSIDSERGISVFRCVICNSKLEITEKE